MSPIDLFIRRPILTLMLTLSLPDGVGPRLWHGLPSRSPLRGESVE